MQRQRRQTSLLFFSLLVVQVLSPLAFAQAADETMRTDTSADLTLLEHLDIAPTPMAKNGWLSSDDAASTTALLYRDVALVSPGEWTQRTGETHVDGLSLIHI